MSTTPWRTRTRQLTTDLTATARLVWSASPGLLSLILCLSVLLALVPAAALWVGKLLLDEVARAVTGALQDADVAYRRLALLLAVQVGIGMFAALLQTIYGASRELLGDTLQNRISLRILHKAAALDVWLDAGHVMLLGFRPEWRGQPFGTFRVLFNAILTP